EVLARPGDADVEQAALLGDRRLVAERLLARQLTLLETRDEDGIPFEALGAVEGEQVDAALGAVVEPLAEPRDPLGHRALPAVELCGEPHEPGEVVLARQLALAEAFRRRIEPPVLQREAAHLPRGRRGPRARQRLQELPGGVARQQRSALERN